MAEELGTSTQDGYSIVSLAVTGGTHLSPTATVRLRRGEEEEVEDSARGDGMIDAACGAIARATGVEARLVNFNVSSVTGGSDALGDVVIQLDVDGRLVTGRGRVLRRRRGQRACLPLRDQPCTVRGQRSRRRGGARLMGGMTITEKILARASGQDSVRPGDLIMANVDLAMGNDVTAPVAIARYRELGIENVWDPSKVALVPSHFSPAKDIASAKLGMTMREFAREQGIEHYFELGRGGIEHILLPEQALALPGHVIIGADSHSVHLRRAGRVLDRASARPTWPRCWPPARSGCASPRPSGSSTRASPTRG